MAKSNSLHRYSAPGELEALLESSTDMVAFSETMLQREAAISPPPQQSGYVDTRPDQLAPGRVNRKTPDYVADNWETGGDGLEELGLSLSSYQAKYLVIRDDFEKGNSVILLTSRSHRILTTLTEYARKPGQPITLQHVLDNILTYHFKRHAGMIRKIRSQRRRLEDDEF